MWLQRWLGELYLKLYLRYRGEEFTLSDVAQLLPSRSSAKVALSRLHRLGAVYSYPHRYLSKMRYYRVCTPEVLVMLLSGKLMNLHLIKQGVYAKLVGLIAKEVIKKLRDLHSVVLYGSVARGVARPNSDVDLLVIYDGDERFSLRLDRLISLEKNEEVAEEIEWLNSRGVDTHISFLPLNTGEALARPPILLDIIYDGIILADDGFFRDLSSKLKLRLEEIGAKRKFILPNEWYWDLNPSYTFGEVVEL